MKLKVERIHKDAILPNKAYEKDAGLDLYSVEEKIINPGDSSLISTGIIMELPNNTEAQIRPRSGLALNHAITLLNSPGTIDEGYRGEIKIIMINHGKKPFKVEKGMKIAQMVIAPVLRVELEECKVNIQDTDRLKNGFGSSGLGENK